MWELIFGPLQRVQMQSDPQNYLELRVMCDGKIFVVTTGNLKEVVPGEKTLEELKLEMLKRCYDSADYVADGATPEQMRIGLSLIENERLKIENEISRKKLATSGNQ
ncbi:hypothetical protein [Armatimonas sp.]|uniref:hypothetical protein n=1 Tax=Armatimonas sp. TaxID=1872638 RepID=UPI003752197D